MRLRMLLALMLASLVKTRLYTPAGRCILEETVPQVNNISIFFFLRIKGTLRKKATAPVTGRVDF